MKRVLTAGKIITDPETGQRVLWQYFDLDGHREATPLRCEPEHSNLLLLDSARRALISQRLRKRP